jgi:hypothetical protein
MPIYHISLRSILILFSHLRQYLPNGPLSVWVPTKKTLYHFLLSPIPAACSSRPSLIDDSNYISGRVQVMKLLFTQFSPTSCYFILLRSKCSSQYPILKHSQSASFPQYQTSNFTPIYRPTFRKTMFLYILIFKSINNRREDKRL